MTRIVDIENMSVDDMISILRKVRTVSDSQIIQYLNKWDITYEGCESQFDLYLEYYLARKEDGLGMIDFDDYGASKGEEDE